jgi:hypothetical protein
MNSNLLNAILPEVKPHGGKNVTSVLFVMEDGEIVSAGAPVKQHETEGGQFVRLTCGKLHYVKSTKAMPLPKQSMTVEAPTMPASNPAPASTPTTDETPKKRGGKKKPAADAPDTTPVSNNPAPASTPTPTNDSDSDFLFYMPLSQCLGIVKAKAKAGHEYLAAIVAIDSVSKGKDKGKKRFTLGWITKEAKCVRDANRKPIMVDGAQLMEKHAYFIARKPGDKPMTMVFDDVRIVETRLK